MSASGPSRIWRAFGALAVAAVAVDFTGSGQARQPMRGAQRPPGTASVTLGCTDATQSPESPGWLGTSKVTLFGGPVAWPGLRFYASHLPKSSYLPQRGLVRGVKALVSISLGDVARVIIPTTERTQLSMDYTSLPPRAVLGGFEYFRVSDGASQVTLRACSRGHGNDSQTAFAGYFLVAGARCATVDIYAGSSRTPVRRAIPFGVPRGSCPAAG